MTKITNLKSSDLSPFSIVRIQANNILRGPQNILWSSGREEDPPNYGWKVLSLSQIKPAPLDKMEVRSVYANLFDPTQQFAVLRAVSWNGELIRQIIKTQGHQNFTLVMPARFVKIPAKKLIAWLSDFEGITVLLDEECPDEDSDINGLRIERDHGVCIFEKVWYTENTSHKMLSQKWKEIWKETTDTLINEPSVTNLDEKFWFIKPEVLYKFQSYQPNWID